MRIVSDYHDYYDVVQSVGQDQTVVYPRARREVALTSDNFPLPLFSGTPMYFDRRRSLSDAQSVVGFCGKVYPVLRLSRQRQSESESTVALCYTLSDVDAFIEHQFKRREIETYRSKPSRSGLCRFADRHWAWRRRRDDFEEFFEMYIAKRSAFGHLFEESQCPIFVASASWETGEGRPKYKIVYNECLKDLEFFRVIDTFTAFQELQMYFGSLAQPNRPIPAVSDKDMVSIKGFDKWSFRKPPRAAGE